MFSGSAQGFFCLFTSLHALFLGLPEYQVLRVSPYIQVFNHVHKTACSCVKFWPRQKDAAEISSPDPVSSENLKSQQ